MTREEAIIILTNTAFLLRDGTRYMKLEHEKQFREAYEMAIKALEQPEIIRCKDCRKHNIKIGFDENFHTVWKEDACPLVGWRGKAKGHEFDYQHCAYAERRDGNDKSRGRYEGQARIPRDATQQVVRD